MMTNVFDASRLAPSERRPYADNEAGTANIVTVQTSEAGTVAEPAIVELGAKDQL